MTDRETIEKLLHDRDIVWAEIDWKGSGGARTAIAVRAGDGPHNTGYDPMETIFEFDDAGTLFAIGAWE